MPKSARTRPLSSSSRGARSLDEVLSFIRDIWALVHGLEAASKRMRREIGVTAPQRFALRLIAHHVRISPGELAELMHVHPGSLTLVLRRLERARLIVRTPDRRDGRRAVLALTTKGRIFSARRGRTVEASVRRMFAVVPRSHLESARALLRRLGRELER